MSYAERSAAVADLRGRYQRLAFIASVGARVRGDLAELGWRRLVAGGGPLLAPLDCLQR